MTEFSRMWKFVRGKSQQHTAERQKLQKELFSFRKTVQHGFPNKPAALAWDPQLRIAAIGTATGAIRVFGKCGVEFYGHHSTSDHVILRLLFVPNEGKLISLCEGNSLHLWEINDAAIEEIKSFTIEGKPKKISALYIDEAKENLLVGTEGGNIYMVDLDTFTLTENIIYQDVTMQNVPEGKVVNPGAVEAIAEQPGNPDNLLIGYRRGWMVLWNKKTSTAVQTYVKTYVDNKQNYQPLESFSWDSVGKKFISSHNDGSYVYWNTESNEPVEELTVYGPFPCKAITKIEWCKSVDDEGDNMIIFSGGMPRASHGDRNTITIQKGSKHVVLDFTSKVKDFFVTYEPESEACESLIILLEEELIAIDLTSSEWRPIPLPYLISLHASAVTFLTFVDDVSETVWDNLMSVGKKQIQETFSTLEWPINGGILKNTGNENVHRDLLITGHEDGSVRFWNAGSTILSLIYTFKTSNLFIADDEPLDDGIENHNEEEEEEWPPFRKVGCFDPFSDDLRLSIKKVAFCGATGILLVAGSAGQIVISRLNEDAVTDKQIKVTTMNIIPENEITYHWKGSQRLGLKGKTENEKNHITLSLAAGYQPFSIVQILPPAAITAVALHAAWNLIAVGSPHGLALYDFKTELPVLHKCTLNPSDFSSLSEPPISRTKSFKKSLRESFRRIRKGRTSVRHADKQRGSKSSMSPVGVDRKSRGEDTASSSSPAINAIEARPVERLIEARPLDDALGSMVKCVHFFNTSVVSAHHLIPSLWAGTNNGTVYIFTINVPGGLKRKNEKVHAQLGKEIQLRHRAPVVSMAVINLAHKLFLVDENSGVQPHYVIICSEEQIKIFSLPNLKPIGKLKLTALEGARLRRIALGQFSAGKHVETCLLALTNLGECIILSIPDLRRQDTAAVIKREDINGISSFTFTKYGEGLYLYSSSEILRISLSASRKTLPQCTLMLPAKKVEQESPATPEKQNRSVNNFINGIPEEDEEEDEEEEDEEEEREEQDDSIVKKESFEDGVKKPLNEDENQIIFNHDVSAITLDSVKDHLS